MHRHHGPFLTTAALKAGTDVMETLPWPPCPTSQCFPCSSACFWSFPHIVMSSRGKYADKRTPVWSPSGNRKDGPFLLTPSLCPGVQAGPAAHAVEPRAGPLRILAQFSCQARSVRCGSTLVPCGLDLLAADLRKGLSLSEASSPQTTTQAGAQPLTLFHYLNCV